MSYIITKTDGTTLTTINDGTVDSTSTSLQLPGPNFVGYGLYLNENLVHILENFAANSAPGGTNLEGQLWFNKSNQTLNVFTSQGYAPVNGVTISGTQPLYSKATDVWFKSTTNQYYFNDGSDWRLIGPQYTKAQGVSGAIPVTVEDGSISGVTHDIIKIQFGDFVIATFSKDFAFIPTPAISGFSYIRPGLTLNNLISNPVFTSNVVGNLTGDVAGNLVGSYVIATNLTGTLNGNVNGNLNGVVVTSVNLLGNLTGNVSATVGFVENFSTANAVVFGGYVNNLSNLTAITSQTTNFSSGNVVISGGYISNLTNASITTASITNETTVTLVTSNFSSGNAVISGGYIQNLANLSATNIQSSNIVTSSATVTAGNITGLTQLSTVNLTATNISSGNIQATGGNLTQMTNVHAVSSNFGTITAANAQITGGNINGTGGTVTIRNVNLQNSALTNSTAETQAFQTSNTAIATTDFVHNILPRGAIIMWSGSVASIPTGWQLCNGSNGSPDLRDKFVVGAGSTYAVDETGGAASTSFTLANVNMPVHTHSINQTISVSGNTRANIASLYDPGHFHNVNLSSILNRNLSNPNHWIVLSNNTTNLGIDFSPVISINNKQASQSDLGHIHTFTGNASITGSTGTVGSATPVTVNIVPPYYALCYIMKMYGNGYTP